MNYNWTYDSIDNVYWWGGKIIAIYSLDYNVWIFNALPFGRDGGRIVEQIIHHTGEKIDGDDFHWVHFSEFKDNTPLYKDRRPDVFLDKYGFKEYLKDKFAE